jgi:hypothetical protein
MYPLRNLVSIMISRMHACPYSYPFGMQTEIRQFDWLISRILVSRAFGAYIPSDSSWVHAITHSPIIRMEGRNFVETLCRIISSHMLRMRKICKSYYEEVFIILNIEFSQNLCFYLRHTLPVS